jgi:hypothetical protein
LARPTGRSASSIASPPASTNARRQKLVEHEVETVIGQRVFGLAAGYEDLIDHDQLRHDPVMAILVGKLKARRQVAVAVVIAVEEAALLMAVQRVIGGVEIEDDLALILMSLRRRLLVARRRGSPICLSSNRTRLVTKRVANPHAPADRDVERTLDALAASTQEQRKSLSTSATTMSVSGPIFR